MGKKKTSANDVFWIKKNFSRRKFIHGSIKGIGFSLAMPLFDCLLNNSGTAFAAGGALPKRFGTFAWGLGYGLEIGHWNPTGLGAGAQWSIPATGHGLSALIPHKDYLTVFSNYSHNEPIGAAHIPQRGVAFSASHNTSWLPDDEAPGFRGQSMPLASIDSVIGTEWLKSYQPLHSYINATLKIGSLYTGYSSWNAGGSFRSFYRSPLEIYNAVFKSMAGGTAPPPNQALSTATLQIKKSVLDNILGELQTYRADLSSQDRIRLDSHLEGVRSLERQNEELIKMQQNTSTVSACSTVAIPNDYAAANQVKLRNTIVSQLMAYALSCDLTRVFCLEFTPTQCNGTLPEAGLSDSQGIHDGPSHGDAPQMKAYLSFVMENYGVLVNALKSTREGAGNLLDQSLVMGVSELANSFHTHDGQPYIFAGKAGGSLIGNFHSKYPGSIDNSDASRVLLTAAHACDVKLASLGMPATNVSGSGGPSQTYNYRATMPISEVLKV